MTSTAIEPEPPFNMQPSNTRPMSAKRRLAQRLLMGAAVLTAVTVVAQTLTTRPAIERRGSAHSVSLRAAPDFQQTLASVNSQFAAMAQAADLELAAQADNLTIARRLSLALVGSGLSLEEVRAFELIPADRQVAWWTDYLLSDQRWADNFAERFSRALVGTDNGPFLLFRRRKLNAWLAEQLSSGVGYDHMVRSMLSAEGLWTDTPAVNFVTATMDQANEGRGDPIRLAGRTSRALLAQRIDCLQCHDDFLGTLNFGSSDHSVSGTQEHFHSLAAFYAGTALATPVFSGITDDGRAYQIEYLGHSEESLVTPNVPFSPELLPATGKPRKRLASWVTHVDNLAFSRATVNRVWGLMFSRPLVEPVDSIPMDEAVPAPLDTLASDFSTHGFDLRRLIRLIAASDAFQRDSRANFEITEQHEQAWSAFPLTQLRPDQVAGSLVQASKLTAFDIFAEGEEIRGRFGDTPFGRGCLAAIRLLETGVRCVEVELNGWDSHINNHTLQMGRAKILDAALAATLQELNARELLDDTIVFCGGEFGRTPQINPASGRDHWPHGFSALLAGGGFRRGYVHGATAADPQRQWFQKQPAASGKKTAIDAERFADKPLTIPDLHATLLQALGIDPSQERLTPIGRPLRWSDGQVAPELLA